MNASSFPPGGHSTRKRLRNIVLVGFMGTGKTTVGRRLADKLAMQFVDMDDLIVEQEGKPIPRVFAEDGEPHFRALERKLVQSLSAQSGRVIGTGGGVVLNPDNIADFAKTGLVVCLSAAPETILRRVAGDANRPLLAGGDKMKRIADLLAARKRLYDAIPLQLDTTQLNIDEVVHNIISLHRHDPGTANHR